MENLVNLILSKGWDFWKYKSNKNKTKIFI
jgi:hypothetical protein